ncbi:filamentation induced by cAMP protein Fic [Caldithrix abyssi DSM 13497]|uniref:Fic family protein n=1 Tax=Caldithrix abyssi DSM 13497 TaxID=880073 RepID=H1XSS2_CALAY|nr:Fic/DOC family N-terminal domain-containing protein [Caldithrix abyssi]APF20248.1 Fic family protein [Caldithrix abyssi DSM 13497]EHO40299.1 filamentation induced by cAMP protein Fic [Caldithrix abyssi DSM 13497]
MRLDPLKPFNELPLLPPGKEVETRPVLKKAITANRVLAELKGLGLTIPNQAMLIDSLILQEAKASSEIENIITTNDALYRAFAVAAGKIDPATKEVLRYREALWEGYRLLKQDNLLTTNLFIRLVQIIKQNQAGIRKTPGTKIINDATGEVVYTPPEGENVIREKLKNLEAFIHAEDEMDPLVKLALIHYQFEAIHPFSDGNGRTGRIINILFLVQQGLLELPVLYLSKAIIERKSEYYRLLREVTENGQWEPWILFMLQAIEETADFTRRRILAIRELMDEVEEEVKKKLPKRIYSKELIEILFRQPYCKIAFLVKAGIASRNIAAGYLKELVKAGILKPHKAGNEMLYLNWRLFELLSSG